MRFTTKDKDNDVKISGNCALDYKGGGNAQGITWEAFRGQAYSLKHTEIKIRPA